MKKEFLKAMEDIKKNNGFIILSYQGYDVAFIDSDCVVSIKVFERRNGLHCVCVGLNSEVRIYFDNFEVMYI